MKTRIIMVATVVFGALEVVWVNTCRAQTQYQVAVYENLHIRDEVSPAVQRWQDATGARVTPDAQSLIGEGFSAQKDRLDTSFAKQQVDPKRGPEFLDDLLFHYLYDLRDRKLLSTKTNDASAASPDSLHLFQGFGGEPILIDKPDIAAFPPFKFIEQIQRVLENKIGHLNVLSEPDLATITIDDEKKRELTCRSFVTSPGDHTVTVVKPKTHVNCSEKVAVAADATEQVTCPKNVTIKCRLPRK